MRFPEWVIPMAATLTQERFTGPEWIFERKYDGIRLLAFRKGTSVRLFSRNQLPQHHPSIADVIGALLVNEVILDGEVDWGGPNVGYHVFDILWLNGRDLTPLPLMERRGSRLSRRRVVASKPPLACACSSHESQRRVRTVLATAGGTPRRSFHTRRNSARPRSFKRAISAPSGEL